MHSSGGEWAAQNSNQGWETLHHDHGLEQSTMQYQDRGAKQWWHMNNMWPEKLTQRRGKDSLWVKTKEKKLISLRRMVLGVWICVWLLKRDAVWKWLTDIPVKSINTNAWGILSLGKEILCTIKYLLWPINILSTKLYYIILCAAASH